MAENENWNTVEVPEKEEVEFEVEETDTQKQEVIESSEEKDLEELDGIQTKGAVK